MHLVNVLQLQVPKPWTIKSIGSVLRKYCSEQKFEIWQAQYLRHAQWNAIVITRP